MSILTNEFSLEISQSLIAFILYNEYKSHRYTLLHKLYSLLEISTKELWLKLDSHQGIYSSPEESIFMDMINIIFSQTNKNEILCRYTIEYYDKIYPSVKPLFHQAEEQYKKTKSRYTPFYEIVNGSDDNFIRSLYAILLLSKSNILINPLLYDIDYKLLCDSIRHIILNLYQEKDSSLYCFNTGEEVFCSRNYKRYYENSIQRLVDRLQVWLPEYTVTEKNYLEILSQVILQCINNYGKINSLSYTRLTPVIDSFVAILQKNHIDIKELISQLNYNIGLLEYIIEIHYREHIMHCITGYQRQFHSPISKIFLSRECYTDADTDILSITWQYLIFVCCRIHKLTLRHYYRDFSWESFLSDDNSSSYKRIITKLQNELSLSEKKAKAYADELTVVKNFSDQRASKAETLYFHELSSMNKLLDNQNNTILRLQSQIESLENYIKVLEQPSIESNSVNIDISTIANYRYLFVGSIQEHLPVLYRTFPNSLFMENDSFNLRGVKVNCIVMFVNIMSHSMYHKINSSGSLSTVPVVYCKTLHLNTIYNQIAAKILDF